MRELIKVDWGNVFMAVLTFLMLMAMFAEFCLEWAR